MNRRKAKKRKNNTYLLYNKYIYKSKRESPRFEPLDESVINWQLNGYI